MNDFVDVLLYADIGSLALLPTVYAIALSSIVHAITDQQRSEAHILDEDIRSINKQIKSIQGGVVKGNIEALENSLTASRKRKEKLIQWSRRISVQFSFLLPTLLWMASIGIASVAEFTLKGSPYLYEFLVAVALCCFVAGYICIYLTIQSCDRYERENVPRLKLDFKSDVSKPLCCKKGVKYEIGVVITNVSAAVAKNVQLEITFPLQSIHIIGRKAKRNLENPEMGVSFTPSYERITYNGDYIWHLKFKPKETGQFSIMLRARSESFYGTTHVIDIKSTDAGLEKPLLKENQNGGQDKSNQQLVPKDKLTEEVIEKVQNLLPPQPWPNGVHCEIAKQLKISNRLATRAIGELIKRGKCRPQIDGVVYAPIDEKNN